MPSTRPTVAVLALGGTIDLVGASRLDLAFYTEHRDRLPDGALLDRLPELGDIAAIERVPFPRVPSHAMTPAIWLDLARTVRAVLADDAVTGVVLTHGTNTLEETAFFLDLVVDSPKPVVLVGAMRPSSALGADGALNLVRAVQVAASDEARDQGALVVLNDTVHAAREVTKTATFRVEAFHARGAGPLGYADADGSVRLSHRLAVRSTLDVDIGPLVDLPRVDLVFSHVGADGSLVDAAMASGARGLVSAGTGPGAPTPAEEAALDRARQAGVIVCQSSRTGSGRVLRSPSMRKRGIVASGVLTPVKARILLSLTLTWTDDPEVVQAVIDRW